MLLGLTGQEPVIKVKNKTFCSVCERVIRRGDEAVAAGVGINYLIHPDCAYSIFMDDLHKSEMRDVKDTRGKRRGSRQQKKEHVSDGHVFCFFCRKKISEGSPFVLDEKKAYHSSGPNNCLVRYRRVLNTARSSLYN